jgi:hypothetical protein
VSHAALAQLGRELLHDLRARPSAYVKCADAFARDAPELGSWLIAECDAAREAFPPGHDPTRELEAAGRTLAPARTHLRNVQLAPWPLSRILDRRMYARSIRPLLLDVIVQHAASLTVMRAALCAPDMPRGPALAALMERDRGLAILCTLARFAYAAGA